MTVKVAIEEFTNEKNLDADQLHGFTGYESPLVDRRELVGDLKKVGEAIAMTLADATNGFAILFAKDADGNPGLLCAGGKGLATVSFSPDGRQVVATYIGRAKISSLTTMSSADDHRLFSETSHFDQVQIEFEGKSLTVIVSEANREDAETLVDLLRHSLA